MKRIFCLAILAVIASFSLIASAAVTPVPGAYQVTYDIRLTTGSSNGSDIVDTLIFEWNAGGDFGVDSGFTIAGRGNTVLSHVIGFEPTSALVIGWGAAVPGVGDEKDHVFTLVSSSFAALVSGEKWSVAFPGVPPVPRTGHSAMIGLLQAAASGDVAALDAITEFVNREAGEAAFDPARGFRVMEWSVGLPIDPPLPVPVLPLYALGLLILGFVILARRFIKPHS